MIYDTDTAHCEGMRFDSKEPQLQGRYKEYWNEFVDEGIIKLN